MNVFITTEAGRANVTDYISTARWSGDMNQCARTLDLVVLDCNDPSIPRVACPPGALVELWEKKEMLFYGYIVARSQNSTQQTISITCHDRGRFLNKITVMKQYSGQTPEEITRQLAQEYQIPVGQLAETGFSVDRLFLSGSDTLYSVIATAYTLASRENGIKYHIGFRGDKLCVTPKAPDEKTLVIQGKSNLISINVTESVENMISEVAIYDSQDNLIQTIRDEERVKTYGLLRQIVRKSDDDDKVKEANELLEDRDLEQTISVDCLGNVANVTGGTVVVQEPKTNVFGLFYIESDSHEWRGGQYFNKLAIRFKAIMSEVEAGSLPNAKG